MQWPEPIFACLFIVVALSAITADVCLLGWVVRKLRGTGFAAGDGRSRPHGRS